MEREAINFRTQRTLIKKDHKSSLGGQSLSLSGCEDAQNVTWNDCRTYFHCDRNFEMSGTTQSMVLLHLSHQQITTYITLAPNHSSIIVVELFHEFLLPSQFSHRHQPTRHLLTVSVSMANPQSQVVYWLFFGCFKRKKSRSKVPNLFLLKDLIQANTKYLWNWLNNNWEYKQCWRWWWSST